MELVNCRFEAGRCRAGLLELGNLHKFTLTWNLTTGALMQASKRSRRGSPRTWKSVDRPVQQFLVQIYFDMELVNWRLEAGL